MPAVRRAVRAYTGMLESPAREREVATVSKRSRKQTHASRYMDQHLFLTMSSAEFHTLLVTAINEAIREFCAQNHHRDIAATPITEAPHDTPSQGEASPSDPFLSREETARMLHVSKPTLRNWEKLGILVPRRISRRVLYRRQDVLALNAPDQAPRRRRR